MKKNWRRKGGGSDWLIMTIGVATSMYMLFMVQALRPYLVGNDQPHVNQPLSPLLERVLVCITFPWYVQDLVYLENTLANIATYETDVHTLILTDDASRISAVLTDWGRDRTTEAMQTTGLKEGDHSCDLPAAHMLIIQQQISASSYTSVIHLDPGTRLTWAALASWALDTEVLEPLNLTRCFYHTTLSPETGEKVLIDWFEPISVDGKDGKARVDAMLENPMHFDGVSSRVFVSERGGWASVKEYKVHRHFVSIDVQSCPSANTWAFTRDQREWYMRSLAVNDSIESTIPETTRWIPSCAVPYMFRKRRGNLPVLDSAAEVYHARSPRAPFATFKLFDAFLDNEVVSPL